MHALTSRLASRKFAVALVVVAVVVFATLQITSAKKANGSPSGATASASAYGVLDRPASADDDISGWRVSPSSASFGLDISGARIVAKNSERTVAAVPADGAPCLVARLASGSTTMNCGLGDVPTASVSYNGAIGLVPDVVKSVTFTMTDGSTVTGEVVDNLWRSPLDARTATYSVDGVTKQVDLMPHSSLPKGATLHPSGVAEGGAPTPKGFNP